MTNEHGGSDSIAEFVDGDPAAARQLRTSLRVLADHYAGEPLGRQIEQVLAGRTSFRELSSDPEFATLAYEGMREFARQWEGLSDSEKGELVRQGQAAAAELRRT